MTRIFGSFPSTVSILIFAACILWAEITLGAGSADARHAPKEMAEPGQDVPVPVGAPAGIDKWHAPPVPAGWGFPDLNVRVSNFAVEHLGQKIGNGECWTLAKEALVSAGAQPPRLYDFGRELASNEPWLPGDILQFTQCQFVDVQPGRKSTCTLGAPNHTAIVYSIANGLVTILQQNVNGDKRVQTQTLNFSNMTSGSVKVYCPVVAYGGRGGVRPGVFPTNHHSRKKHKGDDSPSDSPSDSP